MTAPWLRGRIVFIADLDSLAGRLVPVVEACLEGGVKMVQLRGKNQSDRHLYGRGVALREMTTAAGAHLFVNDRVDLALALEADGVHLGQEDLPVSVVKGLSRDCIVGKTCRTPESAEEAQGQGADYVSVGAMFPSLTKPSVPVVGLERLGQIKGRVQVPVCAIGGINAANLREVLRAGADFVAVISALSGAEEPRKTAALLGRICEEAG